MRSAYSLSIVALLAATGGPCQAQFGKLLGRALSRTPAPVAPIIAHGVARGAAQHGGNQTREEPSPFLQIAGVIVFGLVGLGVFLGCSVGAVVFAHSHAFAPRDELESMSESIGTSNPVIARFCCLVALVMLLCPPILMGAWLLTAACAIAFEHALGPVSLVAVFLLGLSIIRGWGRSPMHHVRIVHTPPGDAPEHIRRAWVGLELPLIRGESQPSAPKTVAVLSGEAQETMTGYLVHGGAAIRRLAAGSPEAAEWWREQAPHVLAPGYQLFFPCAVCERVEGAESQVSG